MAHNIHLIWHLVKRDFQLRHTGSAVGFLWTLVIPLSQLAVLTFTFGTLIRVDIEHYSAFVYSALLPWTWFSGSLSSAGHLFLSNRDLLRRPGFPPSTLIFVNILTHLVTFVISLPLLYGLMKWYGRPVRWNVLTFLVLLIIQGALTAGLSFMIATWNVFFRDIAQLVTILLSLLFFLTPIFYRPIMESEYRAMLDLNPMVPLIGCYRTVLFEGAVPEWDVFLTVAAASLAIGGLGYVIYRRWLPAVIDLI